MIKVLRFLRSFHSWLGLLVLPWVIFFGVTGFYLNHQQAVLSVLPDGQFDEQPLRSLTRDTPVTKAEAEKIAESYWPRSPVTGVQKVNYHDFLSWRITKERGYVLVAIETGHYYVKSKYMRSTYAPDGTRLNRKIYWRYVFGIFHKTGWMDWSLQTFFADLVSFALIGFGLSGLLVWYLPKHKRVMRRIFS